MSEFNSYSHESRKAFKEAETSLVLGVLAGPNDPFPNYVNEISGITLNSNQNGILMFIKPISPEPFCIQQHDQHHLNLHSRWSTLYVVRPKSDLGNFLPVGYQWQHDERKKIELLKQKFEGKIITFSPIMKYVENERIYKNIKVVNCGENYKSGTLYDAVPRLTDVSPNEFEQKILNEEEIELYNFSYYSFGPNYVICDDYLYHFKSHWRKGHQGGWIPNNPNQIRRYFLDTEWEQKYIYGTDKIFFLEEEYLLSLTSNSPGEIISKIQSLSVETFEGSPVNLDPPLKQINEKKATFDEYQFLEHLMYLAKQRGLGYTMDILVNFHVSVKTNDVTILSGMSGTGKSQLAVLYAEALGIYNVEANEIDILREGEKKHRFLVVPIRPSFTQPEDLLGYLNASNGIFVPSDTGFVDLLVRASKDQENMHMVLFDEMNLAQVEHWFAPFISLMELPINQRFVQLYSSNQTCHNKSDYPSSIHLGDNIIFIGTANMDETTRGFSDRLLDRMNVVVPNKMSFISFIDERENFNDEGYGSEPSDDFGRALQFKRWVSDGDPWKVFNTDELQFFDELHAMINKADSQKGVSFRTLKKIAEFIKSVPDDKNGLPFLDRETIIDLQVKQRILTKIRGSSEQFRELIGESADGESVDSLLFKHFTSEQARKISHFTETIRELKRKARELYMYEYAS